MACAALGSIGIVIVVARAFGRLDTALGRFAGRAHRRRRAREGAFGTQVERSSTAERCRHSVGRFGFMRRRVLKSTSGRADKRTGIVRTFFLDLRRVVLDEEPCGRRGSEPPGASSHTTAGAGEAGEWVGDMVRASSASVGWGVVEGGDEGGQAYMWPCRHSLDREVWVPCIWAAWLGCVVQAPVLRCSPFGQIRTVGNFQIYSTNPLTTAKCSNICDGSQPTTLASLASPMDHFPSSQEPSSSQMSQPGTGNPSLFVDAAGNHLAVFVDANGVRNNRPQLIRQLKVRHIFPLPSES